MRFALTTQASPDQVLRALTDFTDRRVEIWSRTLDPKTYELRDLGDTWAVARESTPGSPFWIVARYDWSDPTLVRWTDVENSYGGHGSGSARIERSNNDPNRTRDKVMLFLLHRGPLNHLVARFWRSALDRYARSGPS